jgi:hypothetical protein
MFAPAAYGNPSAWQEGASMSDSPGTGNPDDRGAARQQTCNHCGGITKPMAVLDSRKGKNYRLFKREPCAQLSWSEEL